MLLPSWWKRSPRTTLPIKCDRSRNNARRGIRPVPRPELLEGRIAPANWSSDIASDTTWTTPVQNIVGNVHVDPGVTPTGQETATQRVDMVSLMHIVRAEDAERTAVGGNGQAAGETGGTGEE